MRRAFFVGLLICSADPGIAQTDDDFYKPPRSFTSYAPPKGSITVVSAGGVMIRNIPARVTSGAILEQDVQLPAATKAVATLTKGERLFRIQSKAAFKACAVKAHLSSGPECLIDDDGDGLFDRGAKNYVTNGQILKEKARYTPIDDVPLPTIAHGLERQLIYQGVSGEALKIGYREFSNGMARPAFSEDLNIPLSKDFPQKVAAKGVVLTVLKIDGLGLTYQIDKADSF